MDVSLEDITDDLFLLKGSGDDTGACADDNDELYDEVIKRYDYIWQNKDRLINRAELQASFEANELIYLPKERAWCPPSRCVWANSDVRIPERASIADIYPSRKTFFTRELNVTEPTVEMYIRSLIRESKGQSCASRMKETMITICRLGVEKADLSDLLNAEVLPIKLSGGASTFTSASSKDASKDFAIIENENHSRAFAGKLSVLDFSLKEIQDTRPFLVALGLKNRFSTKLVEKVTKVEGGSLDRELTRQFRRKSPFILR